MNYNPLIVRLQHSCQLSNMEARSLHDLCCDRRDIARSVNILHHGGPANHIRLVISGWAAHYTTLPNGTRQITALLLPGDLCNLHSAALTQVDQGIMALTPMRIAYVVPQSLDRLERASSEIGHAMAWSSLIEQATLRAWIINMGCNRALQRVAHLLSELAERIALSAPDNTGSKVFPMTQVVLADTLGLTSIHVNRVLHELRQRALISSRRGGLTIIDRPGLRKLGAFDSGYLRLQTTRLAQQIAA